MRSVNGALHVPGAEEAMGGRVAGYLKGRARDVLAAAADGYAARLVDQPFLGGDSPMASDIWLYPALHWIARGTALADQNAPEICATLTSSRPALADWMHRFRAVPGIADTYPPHWRT